VNSRGFNDGVLMQGVTSNVCCVSLLGILIFYTSKLNETEHKVEFLHQVGVFRQESLIISSVSVVEHFIIVAVAIAVITILIAMI
jgi:hypothetical protein